MLEQRHFDLSYLAFLSGSSSSSSASARRRLTPSPGGADSGSSPALYRFMPYGGVACAERGGSGTQGAGLWRVSGTVERVVWFADVGSEVPTFEARATQGHQKKSISIGPIESVAN
jgi:hypothetical protein